MNRVLRHGRPPKTYTGKQWWIGHVLRCEKCGCRYMVERVPPEDIERHFMFTHCPECKRINLHHHNRFARLLDWICEPSRPGPKTLNAMKEGT